MLKSNIQWNAKQVSKMFDNNCLHFDNAIQRGNVWDKKRQSLLIDSMLRGYPIPPMYTIKTEDKVKTPKGMVSVFDCIDGKQRCTAINEFKSNKFALTGLEVYTDGNGNEIDLNGLTYDGLDEDMKDTFDSYSLTVYFFTDITDDEVSEMMSRLNNGKPLTGIETARIKAKNLPAIISLANHPIFTENLSETAIKGYVNEDIVIKTAMQTFDNSFELSTKNVKIGYESFAFSKEQIEQLETVLDTAYCAINSAKEQMSKRNAAKLIKKTNLVSIIYLASKHTNGDYENVASALAAFFGGNDKIDCISVSEEYNNACMNGTNHADNVLIRNDALSKKYNSDYAPA